MMTSKVSAQVALAAAAVVGIASQSASAATFYWDNNGTTVGFGTAGGTWAQNSTSGGTSARWKTDSAGLIAGSATQTTTDADIFNFGTAANGLAAGTITVSGSVTMGDTNYGSASGAITLNGGTAINFGAAKTITTNNSATNVINTVVGGAATSLTKAGSGTLRLNGANTYSGTTIVNAGTLQIGNYTGLNNTSGITVANGSTLNLVQVGTGTTTNSTNKNVSLNGTLGIIGGTSTNRLNQTWTGNITLTGNSTITNNGNSLWDIDGQIDLGSNTLAFQTDGTNSRIDGNIIGSGGSLNKTSAQNLTLSGTNTYTGTSTISGGRLQFAKQVSLYNNTPANWTAANIVVANTGVLSLNVGGTGEFTTADVTTLLNNLGGANGTSSTGFAAGSGIAFDTTNTSGGSFTVADAIADSTGTGGGSIGVTKLGASTTLVLTNANSYSGTTTVFGGTLRLENAGALGSSSQVTLNSSTTTLSIGTDTALAGPKIVSTAGTIVSDRATPGTGLTHSFSGVSRLGSGNTNITAGPNVTSGTAAIQFASLDNDSGTTANFGLNPTTANAIITGDVTMGATATGSANLTLGGDGSVNSIGGSIKKGSRDGTTNVVKSGTGTWTLSGTASDYTGTTTINAGTLLVNGSTPATSAVSVNGGTLGGTGTVGGNVTVGTATVAPGNSPGTIVIDGNLGLGSGSVLAFELAAGDTTVGGGINDLIDGVNDLTLDGTLNVSSSPLGVGTWRLLNYSGILTDNTLDLGTLSLQPAHSASIQASGGQVNLVVIPEPTTLGLLATAGLFLGRRKRVTA